MVTKTTSGNIYRCSICGDGFMFFKAAKDHEDTCGIQTLDNFMNDDINDINLINNIPELSGSKSRQTALLKRGDKLQMEMKPKLDEDEVVERPTNTTLEGEIEDWVEGTREEIFDMDEDEKPKYGSKEDRMIQITGRVENDDGSFNFAEVYRRHDTISDQQDLGKFLKRYGQPEQGMEVDVSFNDDGQASVVIE